MKRQRQTLNTTKKRAVALSAFLLIALGALSACSKEPAKTPETSPPPAETAPGTTPTAPSTPAPQPGQTGGAVEPAKPTVPPVKLATINYAKEDKDLARNSAKLVGVTKIYAPMQGAEGDRLDQVQTSGKVLTLRYTKMTVQQSTAEIKPSGTPESEKDVKLKSGIKGRWVTIGGKSALYVAISDVYLVLNGDAIPNDQLEAIADTLALLE